VQAWTLLFLPIRISHPNFDIRTGIWSEYYFKDKYGPNTILKTNSSYAVHKTISYKLTDLDPII